jgi:1-acyl-sn-glycerol-3-phosphate acyltransferase
MFINIFKYILVIFYYICLCVFFPLVLLPVYFVAQICKFLGLIYQNDQIHIWNWFVYYGFIYPLNIHYEISGAFINQGFILSNHRTFCDFAYDPYVSNSIVISRSLAAFSIFFASIIAILDNKIIIIDRTKSRQIIFDKIINFMKKFNEPKRILFFPEGTRRSHTKLTLEETKKIIKPGLLKSIYEYKDLPVQIMMSSNKEKVFNEKKLSINIGETIYTQLSNPINPGEYNSFDEFLEEIHLEWHRIFCLLYKEN